MSQRPKDKVARVDAFCEAGSESLGAGFLAGEPLGESEATVDARSATFALVKVEKFFDPGISELLDRTAYTWDVAEIDPNTEDHGSPEGADRKHD